MEEVFGNQVDAGTRRLAAQTIRTGPVAA